MSVLSNGGIIINRWRWKAQEGAIMISQCITMLIDRLHKKNVWNYAFAWFHFQVYDGFRGYRRRQLDFVFITSFYSGLCRRGSYDASSASSHFEFSVRMSGAARRTRAYKPNWAFSPAHCFSPRLLITTSLISVVDQIQKSYSHAEMTRDKLNASSSLIQQRHWSNSSY